MTNEQKKEAAEMTSTVKFIGSGGTGGDPVVVDSENGKIVRIRPLRWDQEYSQEELAGKLWEFESHGRKFSCPEKSAPPYYALAYKKRVYSKNRVKYPLKRVDWEPGGDPEKINAQNRGKSKFVRISWDEACDIVASEIKRIREAYGPNAILAVGENGHKETKSIHQGGGCHTNLLGRTGGYSREVRTPDSIEGYWWGSKHVWGKGSFEGMGMMAPYVNMVKDVTDHTELIMLQAGDWETAQNFSSQFWSRVLRWWLDMGKKFVSIDPFCNYTTICHDGIKWVPILPNTDVAFDMAIMYTWIKEDLYDKEYVETHTVGFDKYEAYLLGEDDGVEKSPAWAAPLCGVPEWTIKAIAREWGKKVTSIGHFCGCHVRGPYSHEVGRTEVYKLAMQGLGAPGVHQIHLFSFDTAEPEFNVTHGLSTAATSAIIYRPVPQQIPRTMVHWAIQEDKIEWYGGPQIVLELAPAQFEKHEYPIPEEEGGTRIRMMWSEKPCNMGCWNGGFKFQDAIRDPQIECFVTNHQWLENDSLFSDLVLPVSTMLEEADVCGISAGGTLRVLGCAPEACDKVGESMSDYEIAIEIGKRFGIADELTMDMTIKEKQEFCFDTSRIADQTTFEEIYEKNYFLPRLVENWQELPAGMRLFHDDPIAYPLDTPSGKIEFWSEALAEHFPNDKERPPMAMWITGGSEEDGWTHDESLWGEKAKTYPFLMVANPARWRVHVQLDDITWFREIPTCKIDGPDGYKYEPVWINTADAERLGIKQGDICKVFNDQGIILCGAKVSERMIPGTILVNKGARVDPIAPHIDRGGSTNLITTPKPISKNCWGFVVSGFLAGIEKLEQEEMDEWKQKYPEAFSREYDAASGSQYAAWVEGAN